MLNTVVLIGKLSKPLEVRSLPSGASLASFDLQVKRAGQPTDTVPVALFDVPPELARWQAGEEVLVIGRARRRFFRASGGGPQSRTEVVAQLALPMAQKSQVRAALARVRDAIGDALCELGPE